MRTLPVIGLPLAATTYQGAVEWILDHAAKADHPYAVEAANTHVAALARSDAAFGETMRRFDLIVPDGMPLVWALNRRLPPEHKLRDRVYGPAFPVRWAACHTRKTHHILRQSFSRHGHRRHPLAALRRMARR
ncbi:MAG: hypothetical protein MUC40_10575 [Akkermansiaceae bacterium]|nr:hypothetical protein [Akkermansiaceae bacterium]